MYLTSGHGPYVFDHKEWVSEQLGSDTSVPSIRSQEERRHVFVAAMQAWPGANMDA